MIDDVVNPVPSHAVEFSGEIRSIAVVKSDFMNCVPAERLILRQTPCLIELEIHQVIPISNV